MTTHARLRIAGGHVALGQNGVILAPWFTRRTVRIPWSNVLFVSPVPFVRHADTGWQTFRGERIDAHTLRTRLRFFSMDIALRHRDHLLAGVTLGMRLWLRATVWLKPLYLDDDVPHPHHGCIKLDLPKRWVRANGAAVVSALETIAAHSHFDQLTTIG